MNMLAALILWHGDGQVALVALAAETIASMRSKQWLSNGNAWNAEAASLIASLIGGMQIFLERQLNAVEFILYAPH
jgi:hypothetical protein